MGGSILAQTLNLEDGEVPDLDDPQDLVNLVNAVNALRAQGQILAYHDRSDGGLFATACEMAFAGHVGVSLNVDMLLIEGDGISDSRMEMGDSKNWAAQVSARRDELTLKALFNEELGVVMQVRTDDAQRGDADAARAWPVQIQPLRRQDPAAARVARSRQGRSAGLARHQGRVQGQAAGPAPGLGRRELEDLPAARQPGLRRRRTRRRRRAG